ncbi:hypothetical protein AAY473_007927 [Plecturocebus cupreus]
MLNHKWKDRNDNMARTQKFPERDPPMSRCLPLPWGGTPLMDECGDDLRVPHHRGPVQGSLVPLQSDTKAGRAVSSPASPCTTHLTPGHKDPSCPHIEQSGYLQKGLVITGKAGSLVLLVDNACWQSNFIHKLRRRP